MKALSVKEPWASMIRNGGKNIETRTWSTRYRGPLLIVATKIPKSPTSGMALCTVDLYDCQPMTQDHEANARCPVYKRAYAFILRNIRPIKPFPVRGQMGFYEVEIPKEENTDEALN